MIFLPNLSRKIKHYNTPNNQFEFDLGSMKHRWFLSFCLLTVDARHFNGGTIRWAPVDPYTNASNVAITVIQSYYWTYPTIKCNTSVPISTAGRSNELRNITCVVDCWNEGGYSAKPINILTDCQWASSSLQLMKSERSNNLTLTAGANFYAAYVGTAWISLNYPSVSGLEWSIVFSVDLRKRPDGFINTPPTAEVISPQYTIVNRTTEIKIHTSDENSGDVVRCRWSVYVPGYRRRKRSPEQDFHETQTPITEKTHSRVKRKGYTCSQAPCTNRCEKLCPCTCAGCVGTTCTGATCTTSQCLPSTTLSTTIDTPGTLRSTSSFPVRQAIDECGGICYPGSLPSNTTLNNCTLSFRGLVPDTWYAVAIQVRHTDQD